MKGRAATLERLRAVCLGFPETSERLSHGAPTFFIRGKTSFLMLLDDHHGDGRFAIWCAAEPGTQEALVAGDPDRFFRPPYVGHRGWLGVMLHGRVDWDDVAGIAEDAYCAVAPKKLVDALGAQSRRPAQPARYGAPASHASPLWHDQTPVISSATL